MSESFQANLIFSGGFECIFVIISPLNRNLLNKLDFPLLGNDLYQVYCTDLLVLVEIFKNVQCSLYKYLSLENSVTLYFN
jgi:hypothetical protein